MRRDVAFLVLSLVLFLGWIGWLASQALRHKNPVVVSRSQLMVSNVDVVAHVESLQEKRVRIEEVLYSKNGGPESGAEIAIKNLASAKGFDAPGSYVLPLVLRDNEYVLAGLPPDPGFPDNVDVREVSPRIYPFSEEVRRQLREIHSAKGK